MSVSKMVRVGRRLNFQSGGFCGSEASRLVEMRMEKSILYWGRWSGYSSGPHIKIATYQLSLFPTLAFNISNSLLVLLQNIGSTTLHTTTQGRFMGRMLTLPDRWPPLKPFHSTIICIYCQALLFHHNSKLNIRIKFYNASGSLTFCDSA